MFNSQGFPAAGGFSFVCPSENIQSSRIPRLRWIFLCISFREIIGFLNPRKQWISFRKPMENCNSLFLWHLRFCRLRDMAFISHPPIPPTLSKLPTPSGIQKFKFQKSPPPAVFISISLRKFSKFWNFPSPAGFNYISLRKITNFKKSAACGFFLCVSLT